MAQATHGSAPDIAGKGIANPYAMIVSGRMLMDWLGRKHADPKAVAAARLMGEAVERVIRERIALTGDLRCTVLRTTVGWVEERYPSSTAV